MYISLIIQLVIPLGEAFNVDSIFLNELGIFTVAYNKLYAYDILNLILIALAPQM
jgi:hypothetical protein